MLRFAIIILIKYYKLILIIVFVCLLAIFLNKNLTPCMLLIISNLFFGGEGVKHDFLFFIKILKKVYNFIT
jgi:hypothetical protein